MSYEDEEETYGFEHFRESMVEEYESLTETQQDDISDACITLFPHVCADVIKFVPCKQITCADVPFENFFDLGGFEAEMAQSAILELKLLMSYMKEHPEWRFKNRNAYRKFCAEQRFPHAKDRDALFTEELRKQASHSATFDSYVDPEFFRRVSKEFVAKALQPLMELDLSDEDWERINAISANTDCSPESMNWVRERQKNKKIKV